jgi:hypothetical protein
MDGSMTRREAEEERQKAAGLVQQAYSGGYEHPIEVGGAVFTPLVPAFFLLSAQNGPNVLPEVNLCA